MSELMDLLLAGMDQPQADQPNSPAEGLPVNSNLILSVVVLNLELAESFLDHCLSSHKKEQCGGAMMCHTIQCMAGSGCFEDVPSFAAFQACIEESFAVYRLQRTSTWSLVVRLCAC
eukprot:1158360-Pelagomonas_calceolata.AAC.9